jgi:hypothetical protein
MGSNFKVGVKDEVEKRSKRCGRDAAAICGVEPVDLGLDPGIGKYEIIGIIV